MKFTSKWSPRLLASAAIASLTVFSASTLAQTSIFPEPPEETIEMPNGDIVEIYTAEVRNVSGNRVSVRFPGGTYHTYAVSPDYRFNIDGRQVRARDLRRGDELSAYVTRHPTLGPQLVYVEEDASGSYNVVETVDPEPESTLPSTASPLPLFALFGALGLGLGTLGFGLRSRLRD